MTSYILIQTLLIPLILAFLILIIRSKKGHHAGWMTVIALIYNCILLSKAGLHILNKGSILENFIIGPNVSLNLLADGLSIPIALIINIICLCLAFYSFNYVDYRIEIIYPDADNKTYALYYKRFFFLYLFFPIGFMGVVFSTNLISMYFFLEILTIIPLYFIMAQFGYSDYITRYKVALMCLFWGVAGATLFLIGIMIGFNEISSFEIGEFSRLAGNPVAFWVILLILAGLSTKLAIVPLHVWMPWVHAEHPTCIAGLLAVYANIAVYIAVRVLIIPLYHNMQAFSFPIMILATITMIYGALLTLSQTDIKRFCACSTISQISYSVFGVGAMTVMGIKGGLFYFLSHIIGKALLFSTAGVLVYTTHTRDIGKMGGLWKKMPLTCFLWMAAALTLSALPPTSGFVGKWMFFTGGFQALKVHPTGILLFIIAVLSTLLTLVYTFFTGFKIFFGPNRLDSDNIKDPPLLMSLPILFLAILAIVLGLYPKPILNLFSLVITGI